MLCSGKHYYALDSYREKNNIENVPIIRIEVSGNLCVIYTQNVYPQNTVRYMYMYLCCVELILIKIGFL